MYTLSFKLKQHTPLIHFQHDQDGATLRATEVKPKLDRFIWSKWFNGMDEEAAFEKFGKYLIGYNSDKPNLSKEKFLKGYRALDYKLSIKDTGIGFNYKKEIVSVEKNLKITSEIGGQITTYHEYLKERISTCFQEFFVTNNFGNRTSKGYGSFIVFSIDSKPIPLNTDIIKTYLKTNFHYIGMAKIENSFNEFDCSFLFKISKREFNNDNLYKAYNSESKFYYKIPQNLQIISIYEEETRRDELLSLFEKSAISHLNSLKSNFRDKATIIANVFNANLESAKIKLIINSYDVLLDRIIASDNRELKSGVNTGNPRDYIKSELFKIFIQQNMVWEKRIIKKAINYLSAAQTNGNFLSYRNPPSVDNQLVNNTWEDSFETSDYRFIRILLGLPEQYEFKVCDSSNRDNNNYKFVVKFNSLEGIERYQSPLLFKVWNNIVFVSIKDTHNMVLDKTFSFEFVVKQKNGNRWEDITNPLIIVDSINTPSKDDLDIAQFTEGLKDYFYNKYYDLENRD